MSVLAHVVVGRLDGEPAATVALAYILNSCPDTARAFVGMLREANVEFEPGRIEAELDIEDGRPDLTIHDIDGRVRVFVENKFWAGLTAAQPVSYLEELPEHMPSALVFVVPEQRVSTVWRELEKRCGEAELELNNTFGTGFVKGARIGRKTMLIASWKVVLQRMLDAALSAGHDAVRDDVLQLQGLTGRMDSKAFLPLRGDEVANQETARRLINYVELIDYIVDELVQAEIADTKGLRPTHGKYTSGRYLRLHGRFVSWLGIDFRAWRDDGISPMWWWFGTKAGVVRDHFKTIPELYEDVRFRNNELYVPVRLKTNAERDGVIGDAVAQMIRIADKVLKTIPT